MTAQQVIRILKQDPKRHYIAHYLVRSTIHDESGDELGDMSYVVFGNLLKKGIIKLVAISEQFWSDGYYQLTSK